MRQSNNNNNKQLFDSKIIYNRMNPFSISNSSNSSECSINSTGLQYNDNNYYFNNEMIPYQMNPISYQNQLYNNEYYQLQNNDSLALETYDLNQHRGSLPFIFGNNIPSATATSNPNTSNRRHTESSIWSKNKKKREPNEEKKRKQFLERNRQAALKCRQRKKQWVTELQQRVDFLTTDNEQLQSQANVLREEVLNLKTLLLAHVGCKVAQSNGATANIIQKGIYYHP